MKRILKDPLLHFFAAGIAVFALFDIVTPDGTGLGDKVIVVDEDALLTQIQYRTRAFEPQLAAERLAALSDAELEMLVREYVREEVLHREALAMGMDANDYIIKRRLVQKVEFLAQGFADASAVVDEAALIAFYEANREDYFIEPTVTFTHVFFDAEERGWEAARTAAAVELEKLNKAQIPFAAAGRYGDRFVYHLNYVERTAEFLESHIGVEFTKAVFGANAGDGLWRGPYDSAYGSHLALVTRQTPGRYPEIDEIRARLAGDAENALARERQEAAIDEIVAEYDVRQSYEHESTDLLSGGQVSSAQ